MEFSSISKPPNCHKNVLSLSIHVESLENLINIFWIICSVFKMENFKKFACSSVTNKGAKKSCIQLRI